LATFTSQRIDIAMTRVGERFALHHQMLSRALGLASLVSVLGCIDDREVRLPDDVVQVKTEMFEIPQAVPAPVDILIVVDNASEMAAYEDHVLANLPEMAAFFEEGRGWWDRRIGVTTSDVGCPGRPAWRPAQLTNGSFFIDWRHLDDTRTKNFEGTLEDHLPAVMAAGHDGCGEHRPFDAIIAAIDPAAGFRRIEADLAVVIIGASDDRSVASASDALAAVGEACVPELSSRMRTVAFAPRGSERLATFAEQLGQGALVPIDTPNLTGALGLFQGRGGWWGLHCFQSTKLDVDVADGMQARCSVSDLVRDPVTKTTTYERLLPACNGSNRPCWRVEARANQCPDTGHGIEIDRIDFPPMGTRLVGQCEIVENAGE
jgi:hypothetical protein